MLYAMIKTKGGVEKTTTAVHLATTLTRREATLPRHGDPQASSASWTAWRRETDRGSGPTTAVLIGKANLSEGKILARKFVHAVIDSGGRDSPGMRAALLRAEGAAVRVDAEKPWVP